MKDDNILNINFDELKQSASYREDICKRIYQNQALKDSVFSFVRKNSGHESDAIEIFQDAIVRFFKKAMEPNFVLTHTANSYILGIAKNVFYNQFKTKMLNLIPVYDVDIVDIEETDDKDVLDIVKKILDYTSETCRQVLMYWSQNYKMADIARLMSYKSEMMARKKKHECIQKLSNYLKENPSITDKIIGND